ncbi:MULTISPECIES: ABC transporter ATP-binding protein [unclassified Mesorhizobium]|uniref:ABC transporter ATP-binding protein n=1 Tax=unclassified Mesorhizobium TaxID=325217 RepID=UPI002414F61A|nr:MULTISPECIES: ABC transporter ATP-binding protein [unclassified Mesorhizobium]MDG4890110.1 ABC transporter ATP-binding protein [Mesorhizobium sp. WSM4887]MDG4904252.1 ABC transporter ATP-binding protein [Mesorhizobium sp. WSM4962]MDG4909279.1 ABC transporter ATP-binding protein [Mesorhizobium sp. WSM4898]MDG4921903.1 ABC transporter ATP-binding protein [Mesorhizobium sp. WSM4989]
MPNNIVELINITKRWGAFTGLENVSLSVRKGEILTLLGPSGCGKSTLMRIAAGFETPTSGKVLIGGSDVTAVPPERRPVNMVFQRYALFPHLDVFDNVAFGLRIKGHPKERINAEVNAMLELVQLQEFRNRWIGEISGGQAQRVALARALVNKPQVLLLDEPLAALDLKIRHHMLDELKRIHVETGTTFIYVTHDQDEAMILSDRVVLLNKGAIEQIGTPNEMYGAPKTLFCAKFFGETNLVTGQVRANDGALVVDTPVGPSFVGEQPPLENGSKVHVSIRPESIEIASAGSGTGAKNSFSGKVEDVTFIGSRVVYKVRHSNGTLFKCQESRSASGIRFSVGSDVGLSWKPESVVVLAD